jgi:hypothetical protein
LRLEHESASIKTISKKQAIQAVLRDKRSLVKDLQLQIQALENLGELSQSDHSEESGSDDDFEPASFAPRIQDVNGGIDTEPTQAQEEASNLASTLRSRTGGTTRMDTTSRATGTDHALKPEKPMGDEIQAKEKILTADRTEQEQIMNNLLSLAKELKSSQKSFQVSLKGEQQHLDFAAQGLDRNLDGIDAAGRRMGTLRRMTEGKGWLARMMLYAYIAGLWLLALVIVFVLPKLRF